MYLTYESMHALGPLLHGRTYDLELARADQLLFATQAFIAVPVAVFSVPHFEALAYYFAFCYSAVFIAYWGVAIYFHFCFSREVFRTYLLAVVFTSCIGYIGYALLPALGPYEALIRGGTGELGAWSGSDGSTGDRELRRCHPRFPSGPSARQRRVPQPAHRMGSGGGRFCRPPRALAAVGVGAMGCGNAVGGALLPAALPGGHPSGGANGGGGHMGGGMGGTVGTPQGGSGLAGAVGGSVTRGWSIPWGLRAFFVARQSLDQSPTDLRP